MLRTPRAGKGPGSWWGWGWGLVSRNRRGPGMLPTPGLRGQGTSPGSPAGFLGSSGQGKCPPLLSHSSGLGGTFLPPSPDLRGLPPMPPRTYSAWRGLWRAGDQPGRSAVSLCPSGQGNHPPLLLDGSSHLSLLISPDSLLAPRTHVARMGLWARGCQLGSSAGSPAQVGQVFALRSSPAIPRESLLPASPDLPGLRGADPVWPPLLLPPQSTYVLLVHFGVPPISLCVRVPHQWHAGALVVGRR